MDNNKKFKKLPTILITVISTIIGMITILLILVGGVDNLARSVKLASALYVIDNHFVAEVDLDNTADVAIEAMIASLDDKWSYYMTSEEYDAYLLRTQNSYKGIGVTISKVENGFKIEGVTKDGPAYNAEIIAGDIIVAIDGESTADMTSDALVLQISEYNDAFFTLDVQNVDGEVRTVSLCTISVYTSPVEYEMLDGDVGYIEIANFSTGASEDTIAAIDALIEEGAQYLLFDVRYNGGGYVHELTALLDYLVPEGDIFVSCDRDGNEEVIVSDANQINMPMAVLVNSSSYSAAELFAAQLEEYDKAITVGEATTGKGRSQVNFYLLDGSAMHISNEVYLTSQRRDLSEEGGIVPQVEVEMTDEENYNLYYDILETDDDKQLNAAINALKTAEE